MSTVQLRVAIWGGQTASGKLFGADKLDLTQRIDALEEVLTQARPWLDAGGGGSSPVLKIFLAPEYLLIKSSTDAQDERAVSFEDFKLFTVEGRLRELSAGLLFIPGTVIWKKPALGPKDPETGVALDRVEKLKAKSDRYKERLDNYDLVQRGYVSNIAKIEFEAFQKRLGKLEQFDREQTYLARNAAYVYYDRELLLKYYKQSENRGKTTLELSRKDKELHGKRIKFVRGYKEGVLEVGLSESAVVRCGVEICADHSGQELKNSVSGKNLHLHILLSDQIPNRSTHVAVGPGGYVVHASTSSTSSGVFDHALNRTTAAQTQDLKYGRLSCYAQDLEV